MTTRAYILIETVVGNLRRVASDLGNLPEVTSVDTVTGPYDVIAVVDAPDLNAVGDLVTSRVHTINGVVRTVTCLSISRS